MTHAADNVVAMTDIWADSERLIAANINPETGLATDYLNHFNEPVMLVQMLPDAPELIEDIRAWSDKSYEQHFADSGLKDASLIIAAYQQAPVEIVDSLDAVTGTLSGLILTIPGKYEAQLQDRGPEAAKQFVDDVAQSMNRLIEMAAALVNGEAETVSQSDIDQILQI